MSIVTTSKPYFHEYEGCEYAVVDIDIGGFRFRATDSSLEEILLKCQQAIIAIHKLKLEEPE